MTERRALTAGDYAGAVTTNLNTIARHFIGDEVQVLWLESEHWQGLAFRSESGRRIILNPWAAAADLGHIFFHEVAHHVCGHLPGISTQTPDEWAEQPPLHFEHMTPLEAGFFSALIDSHEQEAESWALATLAAFEAQHGPFLVALGVEEPRDENKTTSPNDAHRYAGMESRRGSD